MQNRYGTTSPYTVGVEEEFQLVAPSTLQLAPAVEDVIGASPEGSERLARELFQDCLEMRTPVFSTVAELARDLPTLRHHVAKAAKEAGVEIAASGLHPISDPFSQRFTCGERYERMREELGGLARLQIIYALHVHVGVPDAEAAIRATNALLRHVPLLTALSANSPFWNGMDTGFASARVKIRDASPRSGLPPTFHSWEEFENYTDALVAMGNIPDFSWFWWDVRPHPLPGRHRRRLRPRRRPLRLGEQVACDPSRTRRSSLRLRDEGGEGSKGDRSRARHPAASRLAGSRVRDRARGRAGDTSQGHGRRAAESRLREARLPSRRGRLPARDHGVGLR